MGTKTEVDELDVNAPIVGGEEGIIAGLTQMVRNAKFKQNYAEGEADRLAVALGELLGYVTRHLLYQGEENAPVQKAAAILSEYQDNRRQR